MGGEFYKNLTKGNLAKNLTKEIFSQKFEIVRVFLLRIIIEKRGILGDRKMEIGER